MAARGAVPQVIFLSRQRFCRDKHVFIATNMCFSRQKTRLLSRQKYEKLCLSRQICCFFCFVFLIDKHTFVASIDVFCRNKHVSVSTKVCLSQQNVCRDNIMFVATNICCRDKQTKFATKLLSWQMNCFVATKIILVAAPANDIGGGREMGERTSSIFKFCSSFVASTSGFCMASGDSRTRRLLQVVQSTKQRSRFLNWI